MNIMGSDPKVVNRLAAGQNGLLFIHKEAQVRAMARPATGKTPIRGIRIPDGLWSAAQEKAAAEGRTMTDVVTDYLRRYVAAPPRAKPETQASPSD